jgi:hypothetical protein
MLARVPAWAAPAAAGAVVTAACVFSAAVPPHGQGFYPRCPLYEMTGVLCPACGATRAVSALCSGHLGAAVHDNLLLVALVPLLVLVWAGWLARSLGRRGRVARLRWPPALQLVLPVVMLLFMVARNLPFSPFHTFVPLG